MKYKHAALLLVVLLSGCATGVVQTDKDTYMTSKVSAAGAMGSPESLLADLYGEANQHCGSRGQAVQTLETKPEGGIPFVRAARASLTFKCVAK
jgi:hypothetical protein